MKQSTTARRALMGAFASAFLSVVIALPTVATADEGGVSFWLPGFFGSLAAAPPATGMGAHVDLLSHQRVCRGRRRPRTRVRNRQNQRQPHRKRERKPPSES